MKTFLKKIILFSSVVLLLCCGVFLPVTPRIAQSLIMADRQKDALLENTPSPRIIFVGGSNLSFGLNSQLIKDATGLNPINTGLHMKLGLKYMIDNTLVYVQKGDIVVLVPEYDFFFQPYSQCSKELSRIIFDVDFSKIRLLDKTQLVQLSRRIPKYLMTKVKPREYWGFRRSTTYGRDAYNQYGDNSLHWEKKGIVPGAYAFEGKYNPEVVQRIQEFDAAVQAKGATLLISLPGLHKDTFDLMSQQVNKVYAALQGVGVNVISQPEKYRMPDDMMFDSAYHLNKTGVDFRTRLLIQDLKTAGVSASSSD